MSVSRLLLVYLCASLAAYPVYFTVGNVIDYLIGDQLLVTWLQQNSTSLLLRQIWSDWLRAMPVYLLCAFGLLLPAQLILQAKGRSGVAALALTALVLCAVVLTIAGVPMVAWLAFVLSVMIVVVVVHGMLVRPLRRGRGW